MSFLVNLFGISPSNVPKKYAEFKNRISFVKSERERENLLKQFQWLKKRIRALQRKSNTKPEVGAMLGRHLSLCDSTIDYLESSQFKDTVEQRERAAKRGIAIAQMRRQTEIARKSGQPPRQSKAIARRLKMVKKKGRAGMRRRAA